MVNNISTIVTTEQCLLDLIYDVLYISNYTALSKKFLKNHKTPIYYVIHSDLCPTNKYYHDNHMFMSGAICTNKYTYDKLVRLGIYGDNIRYLPNFSHINVSAQLSCVTQINYIGRFSPEKNLPMLLHAFQKLPHIQLRMFGSTDNSYCQYIKNICSHLKLVNVHIFDYVTDPNMLYKSANCIILPSVHEGLPYCLIDAQKYGIPIIANDISNIKYHIPIGHYFTFDGYSKTLDDVIYVDSYDVLLQMIGYTTLTITHKNVNDVIKPIAGIFGTRLCVPYGGELYTSNVNLIVDTILSVAKC